MFYNRAVTIFVLLCCTAVYHVAKGEESSDRKGTTCPCESYLDVCCGNPPKCVAYYLCLNGTVNTDGEGIIDIRSNKPPGEYKPSPTNEAVSPKAPTPTPSEVKTKDCGQRNPDGIGFRITGDDSNEAFYGEFPWMVAVLRLQKADDNSTLNVYHCGGALIHPQVVVTAAYCVNGASRFIIRAGEWDVQTEQELYPQQDREVGSVVVHPQFNPRNLQNDIALLFLKRPVEIAENVDVVCLPPQGTIATDDNCYVSGWGKDVYGVKGRYQSILKKVGVPMVPRDSCQEQLRKARLGEDFQLHESFVCAGGAGGKDACNGDGGSPLVCPIPGKNGRYQQVGIVSWGVKCGEFPGVYTNLGLYRNWIDQQMELKNFNKTTYKY